MTHGVPLLCLSIRNGSGEDRRAGVSDRRGRRSGFLCTSTVATVKNHAAVTSPGAEVSNPFWLAGPGGQLQRAGSGCSAERRRRDGAEDEPRSQGVSGKKRREPNLQYTRSGGGRKRYETSAFHSGSL